MLRREAISLLLAAGARGGGLDAFLGGVRGSALLVDVRTRRLVAMGGGGAMAGRAIAPPGSTLKPFVLAALLADGRLRESDAFPCTTMLHLAGRAFDCVHPPRDTPLRIVEALAYSCNCFTAQAAGRFAPGELARHLERAGLSSRSGLAGADEVPGRVGRVMDRERQRIQALGEYEVLATPAGLALAYARLAGRLAAPELRPVLDGLEAAVESGTARHAAVAGVRVAGKTGTALSGDGERVAWFAGFAPSRTPQVVVVAMLGGRSGGGDAAPVAGRILAAWKAGKL